MDEEVKAIAERILKHLIETAMDESWPQSVKDEFVEKETRKTRMMAELIVKGRKRAAQEARFRNALGIRLKVPKKPPDQ